MRLQHFVLISFLIPLLNIMPGCTNQQTNDQALSLSPEKEKRYQFSLLRTGVDTSITLHTRADTFRLEGSLETLNEPDSSTHFRFTFSNFQLRSSITKQQVVFVDKAGRKKISNSSISDERDSLLQLLTGMHILLTVNRKGEVLAVDGLDQLIDSLSAMSKLEVRSVHSTFENYLSETALKDIFNQVFYLFPDKTVKVSEQWGNDITLVSKAPVLFSNMYKLEGLMNDRAIIRITSLVSARAGEEGKTYMKGKQDGMAEVSRWRGLPLHLETVSSFVTTIDHYDSTGKEKLKMKRAEKTVVDIALQL